MSDYPNLSAQVIGQAESALGALLDPVLARAGLTFHQWLVLTVTAASGGAASQDQVVTRITDARKIGAAPVRAAITGLAGTGLAEVRPGADPMIVLTAAGQARFGQLRAEVGEITARVFSGFPADDLATAGRVLSIITSRASAELTRA